LRQRHRDLVYTALIMVLTSFGFRFRVAAVRVLRIAIVALKGTPIIYSRTGMHEVNCRRDGLIGRTGFERPIALSGQYGFCSDAVAISRDKRAEETHRRRLGCRVDDALSCCKPVCFIVQHKFP